MEKNRIPTRNVGAQAEDAVRDFYRQHGYQLLAQNYCIRGGEIDLIMQKADVVHFVEVKARRSSRYGAPQEAVTYQKRQRLRRTAQVFLVRHPALTHQATRFLFDIAEVYLDSHRIHVLSDAFGLEEA